MVDIYAMFVQEREKREKTPWRTSSEGYSRNTKGRLKNFELAFEIVNFVPLVETPWCSHRDIVTRPVKSTFTAAAPTVIGANILLDLAIVESIPYRGPDMPSSLFDDPRQNGELGRLLSMCDDARNERIEPTEVEAALRDARVPTSVVDFVLKWVKKQINLLSDLLGLDSHRSRANLTYCPYSAALTRAGAGPAFLVRSLPAAC